MLPPAALVVCSAMRLSCRASTARSPRLEAGSHYSKYEA